MKLKNFLSSFMASAMIICAMVSCTDLSGIEERLDNLESDVQALQTLAANLNKNVESLYYLKDGAVITNIQEVQGGWDLTLSDGRKLELRNGVNGADGKDGANGKDGKDGAAGHTPVVSISEDGYWVIDNVKQNVKAVATDGKTPQFGVDAQGYWTVSYDGGTPERIKDVNGNYVSAKVEVTSGSVPTDSYFKSVTVVDNTLVIVLRDADETVVTVPIIKGFSFIIKKDGAVVEGVQKVAEGATVEFDVEQTGVAAAAIVACPTGFEVELTETKLTVTAVVDTKATASSSKDIAILAVSTNGASALSKIQVEKAAAEEGGDEPEQPETPETPETPEIPDTPVEPEQPTYTGNMKKWMDGEKLTIGNVEFDKTMFEGVTPVVITAENAAETKINADGIYFIEAGVTATYDMTGVTNSKLLVIGNDPEQRSNVNLASQIRLGFTDNTDYAVFCNVSVNCEGAANYPLNLTNNAAGVFEYVIFDNCFVTPYSGNGNFHYNGVAGKGFANFVFNNSEMLVPEGQAAFKMIAASKGQNYSNITFENSIIYSKKATATKFNIWEGWANGITSVLEKLTIKQCSFINLQINNGFVRVSDLNEIDIQNNVFYTPDSSVASWQYILRPETNGPAKGTGKNNFAYINGNESQSYKMFYNDAHMNAIGAEQFKKSPALFDTANEAVFDLANMVFKPSKNYKQHGAQR